MIPMNEKLQIAIEFTEKIKHIKGVLMVVLFGSVARGEARPDSDIDIGIIYSHNEKFEVMSKINPFKHKDIQITLIQVKDLPKETELVGAISGEGLLLHGSPMYIQAKKIKLEPKVLFNYDLSGLLQTDKVKFSRALYGSVSTSINNQKVYQTKTQGVTSELGIEKISKSVLLAERRKASQLTSVFKRFKVKYKEIPLWTY